MDPLVHQVDRGVHVGLDLHVVQEGRVDHPLELLVPEGRKEGEKKKKNHSIWLMSQITETFTLELLWKKIIIPQFSPLPAAWHSQSAEESHGLWTFWYWDQS